jgi:hypothetical protein
MQYDKIGHMIKKIGTRHGCNIYIRGESLSESRLLNENTGKYHTQKINIYNIVLHTAVKKLVKVVKETLHEHRDGNLEKVYHNVQ